MIIKRKHPMLVAILIVILLVILLCFGTLGYLCWSEKHPAPADQYDAIIVLGAQVKRDGTPSVQLQYRLDTAYEAWKNHPCTVVVCGGQGADEPMTEAELMKRVLTEQGIPADSILMDPDSVNTRQNLQHASKLLEGYSAETVLIVTSEYHLPRAVALAQDEGFHACGIGSPVLPEYWLKNHARETLAWLKYWGQKYLHLPLN